MNAQKRHWCFTAYAGHLGLDDDFSGEEIIDAMRSHWESVNDLPGIRYAIAQIEKCPTSQRLHIQGYLEFKDSKRMESIAGEQGVQDYTQFMTEPKHMPVRTSWAIATLIQHFL